MRDLESLDHHANIRKYIADGMIYFNLWRLEHISFNSLLHVVRAVTFETRFLSSLTYSWPRPSNPQRMAPYVLLRGKLILIVNVV